MHPSIVSAALQRRQLSQLDSQSHIYGRIIAFAFTDVNIFEFVCESCGYTVALPGGQYPCPQCQHLLNMSRQKQQQSTTIKLYTYQVLTVNGIVKCFGFDEYNPGKCYELDMGENNQIIGAICQIPQSQQNARDLQQVVRYLLNQAENMLLYLNPMLQDGRNQLKVSILQLQLTVLSGDKLIIKTDENLLLSQLFEGVFALLQQNSQTIVTDQIRNQIQVCDDCVTFAAFPPQAIIYLNAAQYKLQKSYVTQQFINEFGVQVTFRNKIVKIECDYPVIVVSNETDIESAYCRQIDRIFSFQSREVNIQQLAWFVKVYKENTMTEFMVQNQFEQRVFDEFHIRINNFSKLCLGIIKFLGVSGVERTIVKVACIIGILYRRCVDLNVLIQDLSDW